MKIRQLFVLAVVLGVFLFVTATYVAHSDKVALMEERGVWIVELSGKVFLTGGVVYPVITDFKAKFDAYPVLPTYKDYIDDMFSFGSTNQVAVGDNETFVILEISVKSEGKDLADSILLKDTIRIAYAWAGGSISESGEIASFSYVLGPYVAYHEYSPYKLTAHASIIDGSSVEDTFHLAIPDLTAEEM